MMLLLSSGYCQSETSSTTGPQGSANLEAKMKIPGTSYEIVGHVPFSAPRDERGARMPKPSLEQRFYHGLLPFKARSVSTNAENQNRKDRRPPTSAVRHGKSNHAPVASIQRQVPPAQHSAAAAHDCNDLMNERNSRIAGQADLLITVSERICEAKGAPVLIAAPLKPSEATELRAFFKSVIGSAMISQTHVLVAKTYMERLPRAAWQEMPRKELIAACLMLAHKSLNEDSYKGSMWEFITEIPKEKLMDNELKIMKQLNYDIGVEQARQHVERERFLAEFGYLGSMIR
ncbi:MAG: cyclin family protein [Trinickia sp.]